MHISRSHTFIAELFQILEYIAQDKFSASKHFQEQLDHKIDQLRDFPYQHRQSIYFEDHNIRDMIFKGYTIVYRINQEHNTIEILRIFNRNKPLS